jgi:hypothetical protein
LSPHGYSDRFLFLFIVREMLELNYYQATLKILEKQDLPYDVLIYASDDMIRRLPVHYLNHQIIIKKDLGMLELPGKEMEQKLAKQYYKGIVNTIGIYVPILDFVASTIPSKVRLTRFKESVLNTYNMRIDFEDNNEENFITQAVGYLKKIK